MDLMAWWVRRPECPTDHRRLVVDRLALVQFIRLLASRRRGQNLNHFYSYFEVLVLASGLSHSPPF